MTYLFAILSLMLLAIVLRTVTKKVTPTVPVPEEVRDEDDVQMLRDDEEDTLTFVRPSWEDKP
jgi:Na+-transporting methylmalonyl-CoA/oxaloacetate decarboxylase gamma subunit